MSSSALISIIITTYNRGPLIMETIQSVIDQTYKNWELIIMDDGSTDNTEELVRRIKDSRIQFIKCGRVAVAGKLKNEGIRRSKGEFISFLDSDDLWAPDKLEKQLFALSKYPGAGFCMSGGYTFQRKDEPLEYFYKKTGEYFGNILELIFSSGIAVYTQALLVKRACIETAGFFREDRPFADIDFITALASKFDAVVLYEPLFFRRLHEANYNEHTWENNFYEGLQLARDNRNSISAATYRHAMFATYTRFGEACLEKRHYKKAAGKFFRSWRYKPLSIIPPKKIMKTIVSFFGRSPQRERP
jgi:glycosyltransferase involved in cell wall biosynthesis